VLARDAISPDAVQREQQSAWESALIASGLPLAGLDLPKPRPRYALAAPLSASIAGEAELLDLWLVRRLPAWQVRAALAAATPAGFRLIEAYDVWLGEPALPGRVVASVYRAWFRAGSVDASALRDAASALLVAATLPRERRKGDAVVAYDLRPFLDALDVSTDGEATGAGPALRMTLRHDPEKGVGRPDEALAELSDRVGSPLEPVGLVREGLVLGDPAPPRPKPRQAAAAPASRPRK
jgi:hypothetical protein